MSLRNRIGSFFLLAAAIFLFIFAASMFSPNGEYEVMALLAGVVLLFVGTRWRLAKGGRPVVRAAASAPAAAPGPPAGTPAPPKKRGPLGVLLKGPKSKKAPANGAPAANGGGGKPAADKRKK
jgi:hypothetical protein